MVSLLTGFVVCGNILIVYLKVEFSYSDELHFLEVRVFSHGDIEVDSLSLSKLEISMISRQV